MQIIRSSKECRWVTDCRDCGCVFIYRGDEVIRKTVEDESKIVNPMLTKAEFGEVYKPKCVVICPECHVDVGVPTMACYRRPAVRSTYCDEEDEWDDV